MRLNSLQIGTVIFACLGALGLIAVARGQGDDVNAECVSRQKKILGALDQYVLDWDETFPTMNTPDQFKTVLVPYVGGSGWFHCPATHRLYQPSANLSGHTLAWVEDFGETSALSDSEPHPDGKLTVGFLDGHIEHGGVDQSDPNTECVQNVYELVQGLQAYAQDFDEQLPPMNRSDTFMQLIYPYVRIRRSFICPDTHALYKPNPRLSYLALTEIKDPLTTIALQDARPHMDGKRTVGFLDGHVERGGVDQMNPDLKCISHLDSLTVGVLEYSQDYDGVLPPMQNPEVFKKAISPYVRNNSVFVCPVTNVPYTPNTALSGKRLASIGDYSTVWVVKDTQPHPDGQVTVGYLDLFVKQGGVGYQLGMFRDEGNGATQDSQIQRLGDKTLQTITNAQQVMGAFVDYIQDHNQTLPPMKTFDQFRSALFPYLHTSRVFRSALSDRPFQINTSLSGLSLAAISNPSQTQVLWDTVTTRIGIPVTGYADGYVEPSR